MPLRWSANKFSGRFSRQVVFAYFEFWCHRGTRGLNCTTTSAWVIHSPGNSIISIVEATAQGHFLREHACDEIQGFLCSKPVPADKIADLLRLPRVAAPTVQPEPDLATKVRRVSVSTDVRGHS